MNKRQPVTKCNRLNQAAEEIWEISQKYKFTYDDWGVICMRMLLNCAKNFCEPSYNLVYQEGKLSRKAKWEP